MAENRGRCHLHFEASGTLGGRWPLPSDGAAHSRTKEPIMMSSFAIRRVAATVGALSLLTLSLVHAQQIPASVYHPVVLDPPEGDERTDRQRHRGGQVVGYGTGIGPLHALTMERRPHRPIDLHVPQLQRDAHQWGLRQDAGGAGFRTGHQRRHACGSLARHAPKRRRPEPGWRGLFGGAGLRRQSAGRSGACGRAA